jgi:hypothetical protein
MLENHIILDSQNCGTFYGSLAGPYAYRNELRTRLDELWEAARRSTNRHFVLDGTVCLAAQSTLSGAKHYLTADSVLISIQGCGRATHVIGTNGGTISCGSILRHGDTTERYYCSLCSWEESN